jgi:hypothetical protein
MGCWYSIEGEVKVKDNKKTRKLVEKLEENTGEIEVNTEDHDDGTFTLSLSGGQGCSYTTATEIDATLQEFGPFVVGDAACFHTNCDDELGEVWVGSEEQVKKGQAGAALDRARAAVKELTEEQAEALVKEMQSPDFWRK